MDWCLCRAEGYLRVSRAVSRDQVDAMIEESEFDDEVAIEPEPVAASHLFEVACRAGCGAVTLAVREHLHDALCGPCLQVKIGSGGVYTGAPGPVVARWESEQPAPVAQEFWHKDKGVWGRVEGERNAHPAPEVGGHWHRLDADAVGTAGPLALPAPVLKLAELAREASWEVRVSYARGNGTHGGTGRPTGLRHSVALAFGRHPMTDAQAVATYVKPVSGGTWTWESVWIYGPSQPHFGLLSLADLKQWLTAGGVIDTDAVRWRVAEVEAAEVAQKEARKLIKSMRQGGMSVESICTELGLELESEEVIKICTPARGKKSEGN